MKNEWVKHADLLPWKALDASYAAIQYYKITKWSWSDHEKARGHIPSTIAMTILVANIFVPSNLQLRGLEGRWNERKDAFQIKGSKSGFLGKTGLLSRH